MTEITPAAGSLVLYKVYPALVKAVSDKVEIQLQDGSVKRVRPKDVALLHPGPVRDFGQLQGAEGDLAEAWELLAGGQTTLGELTELAFGAFTPAAAWTAWQWVAEGLYFSGPPEAILVRSVEAVAADRAQREAKENAERAWGDFMARLQRKAILDEDHERLQEVERLALLRSERSRILQALNIQEKPEYAHRLLVELGYWTAEHNPYPARFGLPAGNPQLEIPELPEEPRLDLTHLAAFAIDDECSQDPDDAISLDGERIWVHVADVAALAPPDSPLDLEARGRAANLYLPEGIVHMLPPALTERLGLGLHDISPALSIGFRLDEDGAVQDVEVYRSRIRVTRHSYLAADGMMTQPPFADLYERAKRFQQRRLANGAATIDLPEVSVRLRDGQVVIHPTERLGSREMVTELMLMAGAGVAEYCRERAIPIPYASQSPPDGSLKGQGMAEMYAFRRLMKPSQSKTLEEPHAGLGLSLYTRATSPLRRYLDLVTHQQLRAHLRGETPLTREQVAERIGASEATSGAVRKAERFSNQHWKLIYLQRNPGWRGRGVVVDVDDNKKATLLIQELAMEVRQRLKNDLPLNTEVRLAAREVELPELSVRFRILD